MNIEKISNTTVQIPDREVKPGEVISNVQICPIGDFPNGDRNQHCTAEALKNVVKATSRTAACARIAARLRLGLPSLRSVHLRPKRQLRTDAFIRLTTQTDPIRLYQGRSGVSPLQFNLPIPHRICRSMHSIYALGSDPEESICCVEIDWFSRCKNQHELKFQTMWKNKLEEEK